MSFDKVTFELKSEPGFTVQRDDLIAVTNAVANHCKLKEIADFLRRYDKHQDFTESQKKIIDSIRDDIFDIINDE